VIEGEDLEENKLLGSAGYAFAKLTEQEEGGYIECSFVCHRHYTSLK